MKIKIVNADGDVWYKDKIGRVFRAIKIDADYYSIDEHSDYYDMRIKVSDAEKIVPPPNIKVINKISIEDYERLLNEYYLKWEIIYQQVIQDPYLKAMRYIAVLERR